MIFNARFLTLTNTYDHEYFVWSRLTEMKRFFFFFFFSSAFGRYHGHGDKGNLAQKSQEMKRTYKFAVCSTVNRYVQNDEDTWVKKYSMQIIKYIYIYIPCYPMAHSMSSGCRLAIVIYFYFIFLVFRLYFFFLLHILLY